MGYHLAKRGRSALILDANERVGDAWRKRWDSLRLFTPAKFDHLPGSKFPAPPYTFPTKDEMADYLEDYARQFELDVRTGVRVSGVLKRDGRFVVNSGRKEFEADNVIVAAGAHHIPRVPDFCADLDPNIVQIHSSKYKGPWQLQDGGVLIVGVGNSGAEIAYETARTHPTVLSGKPSAQLPFKHGPAMARYIFPIVRFMGLHVLTRRTPIGRMVGPKFVKQAAPLIRVKLKDLEAASVERVGRTAGVKDGRPVLDDGRVLDIKNVIWCTGFREDYSWLDLNGFGEDGGPVHKRGVVEAEPGLYFMGLLFQFAVASDVLPGIGRDAAYIAKHIASQRSSSKAVPHTVSA
jgi:putative flavoprotein involved in K+ transport